MSDNYPFAQVAICSDPVVGNKIASAIDPDDGSGTFGGEFGVGLRLIGTQGPATHWAADSLLSAGRYAVVRHFIDHPTEYHPALLAAGLTEQDIDDAHACMVVDAGPREQFERYLPEFIASLGYEFVLGDG